MIRIGPAGIPLSCKGRTLKDGIIYTKSLELDSLEVQFVRGIRMTEEDAAEVGEVAEAADVELHVHAPYYTNLAGDERNLELSRDKILKAANLANIMGAHTVVTHPGFYGDLTPNEALERIIQVTGDLRDEFKANKWKPKLAIETMGKRAVFGSLEEVIDVCKEVKDVLPVVDFAHIHARGNGSLNTVEDFQEVFDQLIPLGLDHHLVHFTGVLYENGNERHHLPIKKGDLRFEPLVEVILENDYNVTLISTSPILEHDAMYMQIVLDRVKEKREQRLQKDALKAQQDAEKAAVDEEKAREEEEARRQAEAAEAAAKKAAEEKAKAEEPQPPCAALTHAGTPCKNPARQNSKYCSSHRGWRPNKEQREILEEMEAEKSGKKVAKKAAKTSQAPAPAKSSAGGSGSAAKKGGAKKASKSESASKKPAGGNASKKAAPEKKVAKKSASTKKQPAKKSRKEVTPKKKPGAKKATKKTAKKASSGAGKAAKKTAKKAAKKSAAKKTTPKKKPTAKKAPAGAKKASASKKTSAKSAAKGKQTSSQKTRSSPSPSPGSPSPATADKKQGRLKAAANRLLGRKKK